MIERDFGVEMTDFHYKDGILSCRKGQESVYCLLDTADPDDQALEFLSGLSC